MTDDEVDLWRPEFCRQISRTARSLAVVKIHDAYTFNKHGEPLFPKDAVSGVIYPVRNPLQICVSFAFHENRDLEWGVDRLTDESASMYGSDNFSSQLRQTLLSWNGHVSSWLEQNELPLLLVKYEDMISNPSDALRKILCFIKEPIDESRLAHAIEQSDFRRLQQQEQEAGFGEKISSPHLFFRKGEVNEWQSTLSKEQVSKIIASNYDMMERLGYLPAE